MKYKTMMEKFYSMNLQLFADDPAPDDDVMAVMIRMTTMTMTTKAMIRMRRNIPRRTLTML